LIDELEMHQPTVTDAATLREYRQNLTVLKFLCGLRPSLRSQVRGQILGEDSIPTLIVTFFRVMRVFIGADMSHAPFIKQSTMVSEHDRGRGRGRGCGRDFGEDVAHLEVVVSMVVDKILLIRDPGSVSIA